MIEKIKKIEEIHQLSLEIYPSLKKMWKLACDLNMKELVRFIDSIDVGIEERLPDL